MIDKLNIALLERSKIFSGLSSAEITHALDCMKAVVRQYKKGAVILREGEESDSICIVAEGEIIIQKTDYNGNANIIARQYPPEMFAGASAFTEKNRLPFDALCSADSIVLFLNCARLTRVCSSACSFHQRIIQNILSAIAEKNISLSNKITVLTKRTIREKLLEFLHTETKRHPSNTVTIPMTRQQMADFLSVDRSALSRELSSMQAEGLVIYTKNKFTLL